MIQNSRQSSLNQSEKDKKKLIITNFTENFQFAKNLFYERSVTWLFTVTSPKLLLAQLGSERSHKSNKLAEDQLKLISNFFSLRNKGSQVLVRETNLQLLTRNFHFVEACVEVEVNVMNLIEK